MHESKQSVLVFSAILMMCLFVSGCSGDDDTLVMSFGDGQGCTGLRGNVDGDPFDCCSEVDVEFMANYLLHQGPQPPCWSEADVNGSGRVDITDLTVLIKYLYCGGSPPALCPGWDF